jgi:hypothetical protein
MLWQMPVVAVAVVLMMALLGLAASAIPVLRGLAVEPSKTVAGGVIDTNHSIM